MKNNICIRPVGSLWRVSLENHEQAQVVTRRSHASALICAKALCKMYGLSPYIIVEWAPGVRELTLLTL